MSERFSGFPAEALTFYEGLEADNSKAYWQANKDVYERAVRDPFRQLLAEFAETYGEFHVFRPNRDVRFSKDKSPYKTNIAAVAETEGSSSYYLAFSAQGLMAGGGYYGMAGDQLERFRRAVDDEHRGSELARLGTALEKKGFELGAMGELKTAPRGYPKDHPRIAFLRRKGLVAMRSWSPEPWMHTRQVRTKVGATWRAIEPLAAWLDAHVGPSELPPEDADRW